MADRENRVEATAPREAKESQGPLIQASGISKTYNHRKSPIIVLDRLAFSLGFGETLGIVGASGIGKSTLLHILGTLDRPDAGTLNYSGTDVLRLDDAQLARFRNKKIGFVFQFHHLLAEFSALENTMMPALVGGMDKRTARNKAESILVRVGLEKRLAHRPNELSGGEQQRVALARALVQRPAILLADEPTGNLDRRNSDIIHNLLMELNQEMGMALVVVTHNMDLAALVSRRVTIVNGGLQEFR